MTVLETARLILRLLAMSDAAALRSVIDDPDVAANMVDLELPFTEQAARFYIFLENAGLSGGEKFSFGMLLKANGALIGTIRLAVTPDHRRGELSYIVGKAYRRQGYAAEAARRMIQFGFEDLDLNRIYGLCLAHNMASTRVMQKAGMRCEGTWRQDKFKDGMFVDTVVYGILRAEWAESH